MSDKVHNFIVTGGCGFIGSALVKKLVQNGDKVKVLDNCSRGSASRLKRASGKYCRHRFKYSLGSQ